MAGAIALAGVQGRTLGALPRGELKRFIAGHIAHIAIQLNYRIQHPGHVVVSERALWVGDVESSTISRFLEALDQGRAFAKRLEQARRAGTKAGGIKFGSSIEMLEFMVYLIDQSSAGFGGTRKRFDLVDLSEGAAYEIKSSDRRQVREGVSDLKKRLAAYAALASRVLGGIADPGRLKLWPGLWTPMPEFLPTGLRSGILQKRLVPGLIQYRHVGDDLDETLRQLRRDWASLRSRLRDLRSRERRLTDNGAWALALLAMLIVVAAIVASRAGGGGSVLGTSMPGAAQRALVGAGALGAGVAAAQTPRSLAVGGPHADGGVTAFERALQQELETNQLNPTKLVPVRLGGSESEILPGGTGPTADARSEQGFVRLIVDAFMVIGPAPFPKSGDESDSLEDIRVGLSGWMTDMVHRVGGIDRLIGFMGLEAAALPRDEEGAYYFAKRLVGFAFPGGTQDRLVAYWRHLLLTADDEWQAMVPHGAGDDGEEPETPRNGQR